MHSSSHSDIAESLRICEKSVSVPLGTKQAAQHGAARDNPSPEGHRDGSDALHLRLERRQEKGALSLGKGVLVQPAKTLSVPMRTMRYVV